MLSVEKVDCRKIIVENDCRETSFTFIMGRTRATSCLTVKGVNHITGNYGTGNFDVA